MTHSQPNNPLHGITLQTIMLQLVGHYGRAGLADKFEFNCFHYHPTIKSCLVFFRKEQRAREQIEEFFLQYMEEASKMDL